MFKALHRKGDWYQILLISYYKVTGFWVADAKVMCFDLSEGEPVSYHVNATVEGEK